MSDVLIPSRPGADAVGRIANALAALKGELAEQAPDLAPRLDDLMDGAAGAAGETPIGATSEAIPEIDYARHPYYGHLEGDRDLRALAADRFFEIFTGMVRTEQAAAARLDQSAPRSLEESSRQEAADVLEREGIWRFRLSPADTAALHDRTEPAAQALEARRQTLPRKLRGVGAVIEALADHSNRDEAFVFYDDLLRGYGVHEIAERYYGRPFRLLNVGLQANTGDDTGIARVCTFPDGRRSDAYYLHVDSAAGVLKVLMYRSETVTAENGAFRYMPGTHKVLSPLQRAVRKTIDKGRFEKLDDGTRRLFMALPACLRHKANFGNDMLPEAGFDTGRLLAQEQVFEGEAGDAVLVDINGAHRGNIHTDPRGRREMYKFVLKAAW